MSYIQYIASARPLPTGTWINPPLREYPSYEAYAKSPDFQIMWDKYVANWESFQNSLPPEIRRPRPIQTPAEQLERYRCYKGKIAVYGGSVQHLCFDVDDFEEWEFTEGRFITFEVLRKHLTLPHIYLYSGNALYRYLCWAMQPGERVEFFTCWNGEEEEPLGSPVREFDLQNFVDFGQTLPPIEIKGSSKTIFIAPDSPQPLQFVRRCEPYLVYVMLDSGFEGWNGAEKQRQDRERNSK